MKKLAIIALASGMAFAAAPAYKAATNLGWYAGVGLNYYTGMTEDNATIFGDTIKLDSQNLGWNLFAGYRNTQHFGTELGFSRIGDITYKNSEGDKYTQKNMWTVSYDANFYMPLVAGFEVFAKGGVDYFAGKFENDKLHTFGLNYGLGLQYTYQQFGARVSYTDLQTLTHNQKDDFNVPNLLNLDVFYIFA
jgi:hypothetical protein